MKKEFLKVLKEAEEQIALGNLKAMVPAKYTSAVEMGGLLFALEKNGWKRGDWRQSLISVYQEKYDEKPDIKLSNRHKFEGRLFWKITFEKNLLVLNFIVGDSAIAYDVGSIKWLAKLWADFDADDHLDLRVVHLSSYKKEFVQLDLVEAYYTLFLLPIS